MIWRTKAVLTILWSATLTVGCAKSRTAGERMIEPTDVKPAPEAVVQNDQPVTDPRPTPPEPAPTVVTRPTTGVSTQPIAATGPTSRPERIWVTADADTATRMRNWKPAVSYYASGNTIAGPVYRILPPEPRTRGTDDIMWMEGYTDALAIGGLVLAPVWMLFTPPLTPVEYSGVEFPPSYTLTEPRPDDGARKVPGMIQLRREPMSQEWVERADKSEPVGSYEKTIKRSSMDSLPGDRR
jgi:hypothetical protein